jgi:hypothetical protein
MAIRSQNYLSAAAPLQLNDPDNHPNSARVRANAQAAVEALAEAGVVTYDANQWEAVARQILKTARLFIGATAGARQIGANDNRPSAANPDVGSLDKDYFWGKFKVRNPSCVRMHTMLIMTCTQNSDP